MTRLPETSRIGRVLEIIWRINQAPRYWTRKRLADTFEVSERMITADLDLIRNALHFEVKSERGRGYYFASSSRLPSVSYSVPEALALVLAAEAGRQNPGIPQQDLSSAVARLTSVIPAELRLMVERLMTETSAGPHTHRQRMLSICSQSLLMSRQLEIVYAAASSGGEETCRRVEPYGVLPYNRSWQLFGYCQLREAPRWFKVDRIRHAIMLPATFKPRDDVDMEDYLAGGWGIMRGVDAPVEEVVLRFSRTATPWVADETWHPTQRLEPAADGGLIFRVTIRVTPEFQRWVLQYGREVETLAPVSLRDWLRNEAVGMVAALDADPI